MHRRYRFKIVLLSLGVVFGYGSAFMHFKRGHHHEGSCHEDYRFWSE